MGEKEEEKKREGEGGRGKEEGREGERRPVRRVECTQLLVGEFTVNLCCRFGCDDIKDTLVSVEE